MRAAGDAVTLARVEVAARPTPRWLAHASVLAHMHAATEQPRGAGAVRTTLDVLARRHLIRIRVRVRGRGWAMAELGVITR